MLAVQKSFAFNDFINTLVSLLSAFVFGSLIGIEREYRRQVAGLRTNVLVAVGAAIFVDLAMRAAGTEGAVRISASVVSGVGFLGAGAILRDSSGSSIRGLNTAATLWSSAAVGACCGADLIAEAALGTLFIISANSALRVLENIISRQPLNPMQHELRHVVHLIVPKAEHEEAINALNHLLELKKLPLAKIDSKPFGEEDLEIEALLDVKAISEDEIGDFIRQLNHAKAIRHAFWLPRAQH